MNSNVKFWSSVDINHRVSSIDGAPDLKLNTNKVNGLSILEAAGWNVRTDLTASAWTIFEWTTADQWSTVHISVYALL